MTASQIGKGLRDDAPCSKIKTDDSSYFKITGAKDVLNQLGYISKTEYDYYENL